MSEYVDPDKVRALQSNIKYGTPSQWENNDTILILCDHFLSLEHKDAQLSESLEHIAEQIEELKQSLEG